MENTYKLDKIYYGTVETRYGKELRLVMDVTDDFIRKLPITIDSFNDFEDERDCRDWEYFKDLFHTYVVVITTKRIMVGQKRLLFGYFCISVTPDLYNDLTVDSGIIWGKVNIDTLNEKIIITNIDKRALPEIETVITTYMIEANKNKKPLKEQ